MSAAGEDINNKVRSIIKEKCTAIHPTLEWKFQRAALNYLNNESEGKMTEMEEIIFHDVYPLYGLSDIRNSSKLRNEAIREDLAENLELAKEVILSAMKIKDLKVFDELNFRIDRKVDALKFGIDSGDEAEILKFLNKKIIPLFDHIKGYGKDVQDAIEKYNSSLTDNLSFIYKRRKSYEESSTKISGIIASYLDEEQKAIQAVYPHYFERYKTDGVDHSIYIGGSLVEDQKFNRLYLRNIRMWQLMMMCGIVRKSNELKKELFDQIQI
ncbi:MAG: hypothetical protein IPL53_15845 [Ignavibacteria bacterium]|nr:hypothetical protein [Ignavibacteria bacterium]